MEYFSESSIDNRPLFFQEKFGRFKFSENHDDKNKITAISRIKLIEKLVQVTGYIVTKPEYLAEPIDPETFQSIVSEAKKRKIVPFPLLVPQVFIEGMAKAS